MTIQPYRFLQELIPKVKGNQMNTFIMSRFSTSDNKMKFYVNKIKNKGFISWTWNMNLSMNDKNFLYDISYVPLPQETWKAGIPEKLLGFASSHSIVARDQWVSCAPPHQTFRFFLILTGGRVFSYPSERNWFHRGVTE